MYSCPCNSLTAYVLSYVSQPLENREETRFPLKQPVVLDSVLKDTVTGRAFKGDLICHALQLQPLLQIREKSISKSANPHPFLPHPPQRKKKGKISQSTWHLAAIQQYIQSKVHNEYTSTAGLLIPQVHGKGIHAWQSVYEYFFYRL